MALPGGSGPSGILQSSVLTCFGVLRGWFYPWKSFAFIGTIPQGSLVWELDIISGLQHLQRDTCLVPPDGGSARAGLSELRNVTLPQCPRDFEPFCRATVMGGSSESLV